MGRAKKRTFTFLRALSCISRNHAERNDTSEPYTKREASPEEMSVTTREHDKANNHDKNKPNRISLTKLFTKVRSRNDSNICRYSSESEDENETPIFLNKAEDGKADIKHYEPTANGETRHRVEMTKPPSIEIYDEELGETNSLSSKERVSLGSESPAVEISQEETNELFDRDYRMTERDIMRVKKMEEVMTKYNLKPCSISGNSYKNNSNLNVPLLASKRKSLPINSLFPPTQREQRHRLSSHENLTQLQLDMRERGKKVEELDDQSQRLNQSSNTMSRSMNDLASKFKSKKWYEW